MPNAFLTKLQSPKSAIFKLSPSSISKFCSFKSRCATPPAWQ